jgi:hypothetical protein
LCKSKEHNNEVSNEWDSGERKKQFIMIAIIKPGQKERTKTMSIEDTKRKKERKKERKKRMNKNWSFSDREIKTHSFSSGTKHVIF